MNRRQTKGLFRQGVGHSNPGPAGSLQIPPVIKVSEGAEETEGYLKVATPALKWILLEGVFEVKGINVEVFCFFPINFGVMPGI